MSSSKIKASFVSIILILSLISFSFAQPISIKAKIIDEKTGEPLAFASIRFFGRESLIDGVVSNLDGSFQIPVHLKNQIDSIKITFIGYSNLSLTINQLKENELNVIKLKTRSSQLREVVVARKFSAREIVEVAIKRIPSNFPVKPFSYIGYYRDYQLEKKNYVNLNEGIVEVFDDGFATSDLDSTNMKLLRYKENTEFPRDAKAAGVYTNSNERKKSYLKKFIHDVKITPFGGNELSQLRINDAIRNYKALSFSFVNVLSKDFVNNHYFKVIETTYINGLPLYHIRIMTPYRTTRGRFIAEGDIYIEHSNYAIHKLAYSVHEKRGKETKHLYDVICEYARRDDKMFLNYLSVNNSFLIASGEVFRIADMFYNGNGRFTLQFNSMINWQSYTGPNQFSVLFNKKPLEIARVDYRTWRPRDNSLKYLITLKDGTQNEKVYITLKSWSALMGDRNEIFPKIEIKVEGLQDVFGQLINSQYRREMNQYRELFVQKILTTKDTVKVGPFISKNTSLAMQPADSSKVNTTNFWMNTPLKKE